jgi:hypothetical protein
VRRPPVQLQPIQVVAQLAALPRVIRPRAVRPACPGLSIQACRALAGAPGHGPGEEMYEERPDHRQTRAHHGDIRLNDRPHRREVLIGDVAHGQILDGRDPQHRRDEHEATECEHGRERELLPRGDVQPVDEGHGQEEDDDVGRDGEARVGVPEADVVDAGARDGLVEGAGDGRALPDGGGDGGDTVDEDGGEEDVAGVLEPADLVEDAEVEEEDGGLGEVDGGFVGDLADVEVLLGGAVSAHKFL